MARLARLESIHANAMHELECLCFSLPWSLEQCQGALAQNFFKAFGMLDKDESLLAYISFYQLQNEIEIVNLAVHPQWRRKGLGGNLLAILLQAANKMSIEKVALEVRAGNFAARALYAQAGFQQVGIRKKYYPDNGEDGLVLAMELTQPEAVQTGGKANAENNRSQLENAQASSRSGQNSR